MASLESRCQRPVLAALQGQLAGMPLALMNLKYATSHSTRIPSNDPSSWNVEPLGHSDLNGHGNGGQVSVAKLGGRYYAFVGHMLGMGTSILDVSDPGSPEVVAQIPIGENNHSHKVRVCGDHILVNAEQLGARRPFEAGLRIYDIRDPSSPEEVSFFETGGKGVHKY